jgi:type I restriction enzyme S subunit
MKKGWEIKQLGDVLVKTEMVDPTKYPDQEFIYLDVSSVNKETKEIEGATVLLGKDAPSRARKLVRTGDVIFATVRPTHSRVALIKEEYDGQVCSTGYFVLRGKENIDTKYLYYFLLTEEYNKQMEKLQKGASYPAVTDAEVRSVFLQHPKSLPEQQRIVSILDKTFAAIAKAKANAEQNLKNAKELFESYMQGVFEDGNWEEQVLGKLCILITKGSSPRWQGIKYVDEPGILFVTSENVGEGKMLLNERKYVEEKFNLKDKKSILNKGDVLTNIVGASIGRTAIYDIDDVANINQAVCILRCNPELILNSYLMNLLNSPFLIKILHDNEVNTARANLSLGFFSKLRIPCPTIQKQQTIVRQLDDLRAETQKLEAVYQKKITDLEELKKSILQKAFAGELKGGVVVEGKTEKEVAL